MMFYVSHIIACVMLSILTYTDCTTQKIPNNITFPCFIMGIMLNGLPDTWGLMFLIGVFTLGAIYLMPMGDVKMYMALCFLTNSIVSIYVLCMSQIMLIAYHFAKRRKAAFSEIKTTTYPLAPFVLEAYLITMFLWLGVGIF